MCCPFCSDARFRLGLNWLKSVGHCFNCDWKSRRAVPEVLRGLQLEVQVTAGREAPNPDAKVEPITLPEDFALLSTLTPDDEDFYEPRRYMRKRGVTPDQMEQHYLGSSWVGRYAYRVIFPVHYKKKLLGLVARDWTGKKEPKYLNSPGDKGLYNVRPTRDRGRWLVLSEGCLKALAIERAAPDVMSAALLGHSINGPQRDQIYDAGYKTAVIFPDPDKAGLSGVLPVAERLAEDRVNVRVVYPAPRAQADELSSREINKCLDRAERLNLRLELLLRREAL